MSWSETKIIHLYRGAQDGLVCHTTEELDKHTTFWVPSPQLRELLSGKKFSEIRELLDDPENERYLDHDCHLISYVMEEELEWEDGYQTFLYVECPEETYARIQSREVSEPHEQEH